MVKGTLLQMHTCAVHWKKDGEVASKPTTAICAMHSGKRTLTLGRSLGVDLI